ncbi:hypothetical protein C9926_02200 [Sulfurovum lithotrophicum]|nr:hypothetical protein C9926_02200 [Sulfurovum lithotrophicum]
MKKILVFIFLVTTLNAVDISNFDIKGIGLGDKYSEVKDILPCNNLNGTEKLQNGNFSKYYLNCNNYFIEFDIKKRIMSIHREIKFSVKPNFKKIKQKLFKKYGNPTQVVLSKTDYRNTQRGYSEVLYWGYKKRKVKRSEGYFNGYEFSSYPKKKLEAIINSYGDSDFSLTLDLVDYNMVEQNYDYTEKMNREFKTKIKEKESNIDL